MVDIKQIENKQRKVMIVDDSEDSLLLYSKILKHYTVKCVENGIMAVSMLDSFQPDVIVLDVNMPYIGGIDVCRKVRGKRGLSSYMGIVLISATIDPKLTVEGLEAGADDFCLKKSALDELRARVFSIMRLKTMTDELMTSRVETVKSFVKAAEFHDMDTGAHIERMSQYSALIYEKLGFDQAACENLRLAAMLHDIGKITTPDAVLKKPGTLTKDEFEIMKEHAGNGYDILKNAQSPLLKLASNIAHHHHERWDGTGYPCALKGEDIPLEARIVTIADVFDALLSKRCYKEKWTLEQSLETLVKGAGTHFDPQLILLFFDNLEEILKIRNKFETANERGMRESFEKHQLKGNQGEGSQEVSQPIALPVKAA